MLRTTLLTVAALLAGVVPSAHSQSSTVDGIAEVGIPLSPTDGGPRRWQLSANNSLGMRSSPSLDAPVTEDIENDAILSNLGCQAANRSVWCYVKRIHGKQRGYVLAEHLQPAVAPDGTLPTGADNSALRVRKSDYDERGEIPCAQERGQSMGTCVVEIARSSGADATVVANFHNGFKRTLYFVHGEFISANATMSGNGFDTDWSIEGDKHLIRVDDQRYELSDKLVFGRLLDR